MATLLVVDDNPDLLRIMQSVLSTSHEVVTATRGVEGIELAKQLRPAVAILDVQLPEIDGIETAHRIKAELGDDVSIIMLSAMAAMAKPRALASGVCDVYLSKPATLDDIRNAVSQLLAGKSQVA